MVDDLEPRVARQVVDGGDLREYVETERRSVPQRATRLDQPVRWNIQSRKVDALVRLERGTGHEGLERGDDGGRVHAALIQNAQFRMQTPHPSIIVAQVQRCLPPL